MFTEIPLSALTEQSLFIIRNSVQSGNRFSSFGPSGNAFLEKAIADIDAEMQRRSEKKALGQAS